MLTWDVAAIPRTPLSTLTVGCIDIPNDILSESSITPEPSLVLVNPTSSTFMNSSSSFNISVVRIELIPVNTNLVFLSSIPPDIFNVWVIDVNVIGCWTTPSKPIIVFVSGLVIVNLWAFPAPFPVNVIAVPAEISLFLANNWNWFSSFIFTNTDDGNIVVLNPDGRVFWPIETGVAATPTNVESGVYVNSSFVLKKWLGMVKKPVDFSNPTPSGLNVFE